MTKQAVIYTRVSTDEQAKSGTSLQSQREACRRYAEQNGFSLVGEFSEDYSGAMLSRPKLDQLREMVRAKSISIIIVYDLDRLTRSLAHSLFLRDEFEQHQVELHTVITGIAGTTPEANMQNNLRAMFAEYERVKITERNSRGRITKARNGYILGGFKAPYGYAKIESKLIINETEAEVVRRIFDWYVNGLEGLPVACQAIGRRLTEEKIPTPTQGFKRNRRTRADYVWNLSTIRQIITREVYTGVWRYGKRIGKSGIGGVRKIEDTVTIAIPAIVSRELWQTAQERIKWHSDRARSIKKNRRILSGLCICGQCGASVQVEKTGKHYSYRCAQRRHRFSEVESVCNQRRVKVEILENAVWNKTLNLITQPEVFAEAARAAIRKEQDAVMPKRERLEQIDKRIKQLKRDASRIAARLIEQDDNSLIAEAMREQSQVLEIEYARLSQETKEINTALEMAVMNEQDIGRLIEFMRGALEGLQTATLDDKRIILEILGTKVTLKEDMAIVTYRISASPVDMLTL